MSKKKKPRDPRVLFIDIETAPIQAYVWGVYDQNVSNNMIKQDWHLLSWAAKWQGEKKIMYQDQRNIKDKTNDKKIAKAIWKLLDEADVVIGQNSVRFDIKKLNARFIQHDFIPPSSYRQIDTLKLAKKHFGFTSNKLEYLSEKLNKKHKKSTHKRFPGFELWRACLAGNKAAWKEMEKYNKEDVFSLEELYDALQPWDSQVRIYSEDSRCNCGVTNWKKWGYRFTNNRRYQRLKCGSCGAEKKGELA
jgi:uncharacterized protein YprB with RNaseH-like and TPR domain